MHWREVQWKEKRQRLKNFFSQMLSRKSPHVLFRKRSKNWWMKNEWNLWNGFLFHAVFQKGKNVLHWKIYQHVSTKPQQKKNWNHISFCWPKITEMWKCCEEDFYGLNLLYATWFIQRPTERWFTTFGCKGTGFRAALIIQFLKVSSSNNLK